MTGILALKKRRRDSHNNSETVETADSFFGTKVQMVLPAFQQMTLSKSRINVSTCPLLSKIFTQSFITVVNCVSQLCLFLNACCMARAEIPPSEP